MIKQLRTEAEIWFGADPELFLTTPNGAVVGSERAIPAEGLQIPLHPSPYNDSSLDLSLIRDGVQVELNLAPTKCREWLIWEIQLALITLHHHLLQGQQFQASFRQVVDVSSEELKALTPMSRRLGCAPSFNWYAPSATIGVNPDTYTTRSAGGHLHFGLPAHLMSERERLPPICDIIIGNTAVLIDRDPHAAERRKVYGRAGEFRLPRHGFEYRTLSNFWLQSNELVSLVTGLMRLSVFILDTSTHKDGWRADETLFKLVDLGKVQQAINTNDLTLAKENFEGLRTFLSTYHMNETRAHRETGLHGANLPQFDRFIRGIDEGGLFRWFPDDPMHHWQTCQWLGAGWERYLHNEMCEV